MKYIKSFLLLAVLTASAITFACDQHPAHAEEEVNTKPKTEAQESK